MLLLENQLNSWNYFQERVDRTFSHLPLYKYIFSVLNAKSRGDNCVSG